MQSSSSNDPYDRLYNGMIPFHNHFRMEHAQVMRGVDGSQYASKAAVKTLMQQALQLCHHLEMHHTIEERHIFPRLGKFVPTFQENAAHIEEHKVMHAQLDKLEAYSEKVLKNMGSAAAAKAKDEKNAPWPSSVYDQDTFNELIKGLAAALFPHLEAEEKSLRGANLVKHGMTLDDIRRLAF